MDSQLNDAINFHLDLITETRKLIAELVELRKQPQHQRPESFPQVISSAYPSPASIQANIAVATPIPARSPADDQQPQVAAAVAIDPVKTKFSGVDSSPTYAQKSNGNTMAVPMIQRGKL